MQKGWSALLRKDCLPRENLVARLSLKEMLSVALNEIDRIKREWCFLGRRIGLDNLRSVCLIQNEDNSDLSSIYCQSVLQTDLLRVDRRRKRLALLSLSVTMCVENCSIRIRISGSLRPPYINGLGLGGKECMERLPARQKSSSTMTSQCGSSNVWNGSVIAMGGLEEHSAADGRKRTFHLKIVEREPASSPPR